MTERVEGEERVTMKKCHFDGFDFHFEWDDPWEEFPSMQKEEELIAISCC